MSAKPKRSASRVTSQARKGITSFLDGQDKRGLVARRFRDLVSELTSDLGGPSELSEGQRQIVRRISSLSVWCESQEALMADGEEIDIDRFQRTANSLRRLCESIGLRRTAKTVGGVTVVDRIKQTIDERVAARARATATDAETD